MKKKTSPDLLVKALKKLVIVYGMDEVRGALDACELGMPKKEKQDTLNNTRNSNFMTFGSMWKKGLRASASL